jgi:hypothetical protein
LIESDNCYASEKSKVDKATDKVEHAMGTVAEGFENVTGAFLKTGFERYGLFFAPAALVGLAGLGVSFLIVEAPATIAYGGLKAASAIKKRLTPDVKSLSREKVKADICGNLGNDNVPILIAIAKDANNLILAMQKSVSSFEQCADEMRKSQPKMQKQEEKMAADGVIMITDVSKDFCTKISESLELIAKSTIVVMKSSKSTDKKYQNALNDMGKGIAGLTDIEKELKNFVLAASYVLKIKPQDDQKISDQSDTEKIDEKGMHALISSMASNIEKIDLERITDEALRNNIKNAADKHYIEYVSSLLKETFMYCYHITEKNRAKVKDLMNKVNKEVFHEKLSLTID